MKRISRALVILVMLVATGGFVFADFNASQFAQNFNSSSGLDITLTNSGPIINAIDVAAYGQGFRDKGVIDAYASSTAGYVAPHEPGGLDAGTFASDAGGYGFFYTDDYYFSSFALSPALLATEVHGKLSYENGATKTTAGTAINLGIARLYMDYAKGTLAGYDYSGNSNASVLHDAIQLLLSGNSNAQQWSNNLFLNNLSAEAGSQVWLAQYNLDATYSLLDNDYAVFAMGIWWIDRDRWPETYPQVPYVASGDILYLVKRGEGSGSDVPEPATVLIWALGGLGTFVLKRKVRK